VVTVHGQLQKSKRKVFESMHPLATAKLREVLEGAWFLFHGVRDANRLKNNNGKRRCFLTRGKANVKKKVCAEQEEKISRREHSSSPEAVENEVKRAA